MGIPILRVRAVGHGFAEPPGVPVLHLASTHPIVWGNPFCFLFVIALNNIMFGLLYAQTYRVLFGSRHFYIVRLTGGYI